MCFFKQNTAYEMRSSDWSSDVCSSDLIDLENAVRTDVLRDAVNAHLRPHTVAIVEAEEVGPEFESRFSAIRRHYLYRIVNRRAPLTLDRKQAWLVHHIGTAPGRESMRQ